MHEIEVGMRSPRPHDLEIRMAKPNAIRRALRTQEGVTCRGKCVWIFDVNAHVYAVEKFAHFGESGDVRGEIACVDILDLATLEACSERSIMIEDDGPVSSDPGVGLQPCSTEPQCEFERFEGVFLGVTSCSAMPEENRCSQHVSSPFSTEIERLSRIGRL